ncbi:hypothetical protein NGM99_13890 [Mesorhizobium sp. RP14(2022)]|uniref:Uncharacterized protein n=1 Tax=Mesorhizobium liriopis TaxID=2953882 RepID=A0ABT1CA61_9HYPH|nr:hypothetical protein [Mesorhizobium liriopis]MCO6050871.1 hypothetical protein [Mesorhizobium liriopis]
MAQAAAAVGHNSGDMSETDRKALFFLNRDDYWKAMAAKKAADARVKLVGKQIKADLGEHGLLQIKAYEQSQTAEGKAELQAKQEAERQAMAWAGVPINTQLDLLTDLAPLDERAFNDGQDAGMRGETLDNPHDPNTDAGRAYEKGWKSGQEAIFAIRKKRADEASTDELIKGERPATDEEDEGEGEFRDPFLSSEEWDAAAPTAQAAE